MIRFRVNLPRPKAGVRKKGKAGKGKEGDVKRAKGHEDNKTGAVSERERGGGRKRERDIDGTSDTHACSLRVLHSACSLCG